MAGARLVLAVVLAAGCGGGSRPARTARATAMDRSAIRLVEAAADIDGRRVGAPGPATRATAVVVFASWCGPCRHELAALGDIARKTPELRVIGVNAYETWGELSDETRLRDYLAAYAPWLRVVPATPSLLQSLGGVPKVPSLFFFDRDGNPSGEFRRAERAPPGRDELDRAVTRALGCSSGQC